MYPLSHWTLPNIPGNEAVVTALEDAGCSGVSTTDAP
jgi:hypothetical protein